MALSRDQKEAVVAELQDLLSNSKMTIFAAYQGLTVADMQDLRRQANENGTSIKVVKNRLFKLSARQNPNLKDTDLSTLTGQLVYAFNSEDEVAPAQVLAKFAKNHPALVLSGALASDGKLLSADEVKALATLPSKNEMIAQVLATLASPVNEILSGLGGNLHGLLDGVASKATA
jgi:large subunit ribosomal protein L10